MMAPSRVRLDSSPIVRFPIREVMMACLRKSVAPVVATGSILFQMANDEGEIERNNVTYTWSVFGNMIAVTAPDGRSKRTHLGGITSASMAKILARELEAETPKRR
jgi:YD repeat-containing protein